MRKPNYSTSDQVALLEKLHAHYDKETISLKELNAFLEKNKVEHFPYFILRERKVARNTFNIVPKSAGRATPVVQQQSVSAVAMAPVAQVVNLASRRAQNVTESFVPQKNGTYVPFGFYSDLKNIISSRIFYPIYITGLSGNGKTMMKSTNTIQLILMFVS